MILEGWVCLSLSWMAFSRGLLEHKEPQSSSVGPPPVGLGLHPSCLFSLLHRHPGPWSGHRGVGVGLSRVHLFSSCAQEVGGKVDRLIPIHGGGEARAFFMNLGPGSCLLPHCCPVSPGTAPNLTSESARITSDPRRGDPWADMSAPICYEHAVDTVIYTCGLMCLCYACGLRLRRLCTPAAPSAAGPSRTSSRPTAAP